MGEAMGLHKQTERRGRGGGCQTSLDVPDVRSTTHEHSFLLLITDEPLLLAPFYRWGN